MEYVRQLRPVAQTLSDARRVGKIFGMLRWEGFFREATGPGWVLAGDAGHFKDPSPGQGIQDAFGQVDALAPAIAGALEGPRRAPRPGTRGLGVAGATGTPPSTTGWQPIWARRAGSRRAPRDAERLLEQGKIDSHLDLFNHRSRPSQVLTPPRLLGATARLLVGGGCDRRALLGEVSGLVAQDARRKRLARHPHYAPLEASMDAGPAEVEDDDGAVGLR